MTDWVSEAIGIYNDFKTEGFEITVRIEGSEGVWNPETMAYDDAAEAVDYTTYGIKADYNTHDIDGTVIQQNDAQLIFAAYGLNSDGAFIVLPALNSDNVILVDSVAQNIVALKKVDPGNVAIMYEAQIRS